MTQQEKLNYERVAEAIRYIKAHFREQPTLDQIAGSVHLSPFHFQRMFTDWAGVSPKKFIQFLSLEYAKGLLKEKQATLSEAAFKTGLSGTGRLHDLFINIQGMTPAEYKNDGERLSINYSFAESPFGNILVASTSKGICYLSFTDNDTLAFEMLKSKFAKARFIQMVDTIQQEALFIFQHDWSKVNQIKLHLNATPFQIQVWQALLRIPLAQVSTYGAVAQAIQKPSAARAVGSAIGKNPVAFLIPCHRVIQASGNLGGYMWGETRKAALIGWEAARNETLSTN